jgi:hypothetical protein
MNNLFYVSECGDGENVAGPIILPDGNYTLSQLAANTGAFTSTTIGLYEALSF